MNYLNYVIAGYAVFVLVLGWEFLASRLQIRRELRQALRRAARQSSMPGKADTTPAGWSGDTPPNPPSAPNELTR